MYHTVFLWPFICISILIRPFVERFQRVTPQPFKPVGTQNLLFKISGLGKQILMLLTLKWTRLDKTSYDTQIRNVVKFFKLHFNQFS